MPIMTIGEYEEPIEGQRTLLREMQLDLSSGAGSLVFTPKTRSIRVNADVTYRFVIGKGEATKESQRCPAEAVERHGILPGQGWGISVVSEE